jgi:hypothetical protein
MKPTTDPFSYRVVVRRMAAGAAPFGWEVHSGETIVPLQVSAERFCSMEAAYIAGQSKLADMAPQKRASPGRG